MGSFVEVSLIHRRKERDRDLILSNSKRGLPLHGVQKERHGVSHQSGLREDVFIDMNVNSN